VKVPSWPLLAQAALLAVSASIGARVLGCTVGSLGRQHQGTESFGHFAPLVVGCGRAKQAVFLQLVLASWGGFGGYNAKWF